MHEWYKRAQQQTFESRTADGWVKGSTWKSIGLGLLCCVIILCFAVAMVFIIPENWMI